ncbi:hypothetical protein Bca4012_101394 [Brassica carinata]|uniref:BnaCnng61400D protein n=2 Tax=Brassica napus TaxID=3708 RepID=A0A078JQD3_BRANA|nr:squamosa promoter-binding-like protein 6 [Brassica napus]XP_048617200.1 squamosa promoter-binding-like protein 6 [Brassica napus]XP_048617201.1 squamosa promoter-binding-like protein 6 [Brassica napus]KAH0875464.1 hypothetical protein HID58_072826 [Brassica napus]CAF2062944.1 unnamed protein product [Brassica napus]CDY69014.1 BnaCnng61400D [Brassica napus]
MDSWSYGTSLLPSDSFPENPRSIMAQGLSNEFDKVDDVNGLCAVSSSSNLSSLDFKLRSFMDYGNYDGNTSSTAKKPRASSSSPLCQVHGCNMDLSSSKDYHKRHRVCEAHSKTSVVIVNGIEQRFCQQCSRFHFLLEFDNGKRSCRRRLAGHNERRRKPSFYFLHGKQQRRRHKLLPQGNKFHGRLVSFKDEPMFPAENMSFYSPEAASGVSSIWDLHEAAPPRYTCAHSLLSAQSQQHLSETQNQTLNASIIDYHHMQPLRTDLGNSKTDSSSCNGKGSSTVDLLQLSSHLQRIEQQQRSFTNDDVKHEYNNELYFP